MTTRTRGVLLVGAGVLLITPDSLLVRLLEVDDVTIVFLRAACMFAGFGALLVSQRLRRPDDADLRRIGRAGWIVAATSVIGNAMFVVSVRHTSIAHTLLLIACAPAFTLVLGRVAFGDRAGAQAWITTTLIGIGVVSIFLVRPEGTHPQSTLGDAAGLATALAFSIMINVVRRSGSRSALPAFVLGTGCAVVLTAPLARPFAASGTDVAILLLDGMLLLPLGMTLVTRAPRYLSAGSVSLAMLAETVLGPPLAYAAIGESPGLQTTLSGALIVGALAMHAAAGVRRRAAA